MTEPRGTTGPDAPDTTERRRRPRGPGPGTVRRVLLDVTRVLHEPGVSGTRRVLAHLVDDVRPDGVRVEPAALLAGRWVTVPRRHASAVVRGGFAERSEQGRASTATLVEDWEHQGLREVGVDELAGRAEGYLLPEVTGSPEVLEAARGALGSGVPTMLLYPDSLSALHPRLVGGAYHVPLNEYSTLAAQVEHVAFLSGAARREFEQRVRRSPVPHSVVAHPGVEPEELPEDQEAALPDPPHFVCLGVVEPRKRTDVVVAAVERLRASGVPARLTVVGRAGRGAPAFVEELRRKADDGVFEWVQGMDDAGVARLVSTATALVHPSEHEGYGLPPLEALALGTPVVTSAALPSLESVGGQGQLRLGSVDTDSLVRAMTELADHDVAVRLREETDSVELPTWAEFARRIEDFVSVAVRAAGPAGAAAPPDPAPRP